MWVVIVMCEWSKFVGFPASGVVFWCLQVASLISPVPKSEFQEKMQDMKEAIYSSNREAPLGRSHDQSSKLPEGLDIINTTFGIKVFKGRKMCH